MEVVEYAQHTFALVEDVDLSSSTNTLPCKLAPSDEVWEGQLWSATLNSNPVAFLFLRHRNWTLVDNELRSLEKKYSVKLPTVSTSANRMAVVLDNISDDTKTDLISELGYRTREVISTGNRPRFDHANEGVKDIVDKLWALACKRSELPSSAHA
ncbi:hypothetical protein C8Q73DRAFT_792787 [Cubamyces lactineus]|nr:hypothetical protein C8Q73DRAFT_792787 [Cubamyces lactineus]